MANTYETERTLSGTYVCEASGDYTLPDYTPEVRRILRVDCDANVTGQYGTQDKTEVGGEVQYSLLYIDGEGGLASTTLDGTFVCTIPVGENVEMQVIPTVENVNCRLGGPRRVTMKASILLRPLAVERDTFTEAEMTELGDGEILRHALTVGQTVFFTGEGTDVTESVKAEPESRLLSVFGQVLVREAKAEVGAVAVRADLWMTALCVDGEGRPYTVRGKIPLEETITDERLTPTHACIVFGRCSDCRATLTSEEGAARLIFDAHVTPEGIALHNEVVTPMIDAYLTEHPLELSKRTVTGQYYPAALQGNYTVDGAESLTALGLTEGGMPVGGRGTASVTACTCQGNEITVEGDVRVFCLVTEAGDEGCTGCTFTYPYQVRMQAREALPSDAELTPVVKCVECHVRSDGQRLAADAELQVSCLVTATSAIEAVEAVRTDTEHPFESRRGEIVAAFLEGNDTLWSVGKRYHVPLATLAETNALADDAIREPDAAAHLDGLNRLLLEYD